MALRISRDETESVPRRERSELQEEGEQAERETVTLKIAAGGGAATASFRRPTNLFGESDWRDWVFDAVQNM